MSSRSEHYIIVNGIRPSDLQVLDDGVLEGNVRLLSMICTFKVKRQSSVFGRIPYA